VRFEPGAPLLVQRQPHVGGHVFKECRELAGGQRGQRPAARRGCGARRERLRSAYEWLLLAWGEVLAGQGAHKQAIEVPEHLLCLAPTLEAAHRALMGYYAAAGWRDRAVQQYRRCARALQHDLGIEPDAATSRLYHRILDPQTTDTSLLLH
jgi:DNA-binding SARP family transcriptional activator